MTEWIASCPFCRYVTRMEHMYYYYYRPHPSVSLINHPTTLCPNSNTWHWQGIDCCHGAGEEEEEESYI